MNDTSRPYQNTRTLYFKLFEFELVLLLIGTQFINNQLILKNVLVELKVNIKPISGTSCGTLSNLLNFSVPQFSHLQNKNQTKQLLRCSHT